jgi:three-Cys-motif partner protein
LPRRETDYEELHKRLAFKDDGFPIREVGAWTLDKLALIAYYLPKFAELCTEKAHGWYFVDGFAGIGANSSPEFATAKGSALLGVTQEPPASRALLVELNADDAAILEHRVQPHSERVRVICGDTNRVLPTALGSDLTNLYLPAFCVLDPYGLNLNWSTVEACAKHRAYGTPYELLVYFSTPGAARSAGVRAPGFMEANQARLNLTFGGDAWRAIAEMQQEGRLATGDAGRRYLDLYESQLRELGYTEILHRPAVRQDGNLVYHLVFASGNAVGRNIMTWAFNRAFARQKPLQL